MHTSSRKTNIGYISGTLRIGGAERQLFYLVKYLDKTKYVPYVINLDPDGESFWEKELLKHGITVINIQRGSKLKRLLELKRAIKSYHIDILQGFNFYVNGYAALAKWNKKSRVIGGLRNLPVPSHTHKVPSWWRWLCFHRVGHVVCNSESASALLKEKYKSLKNILTISNAILVPSIKVVEDLRSKIRNQLGYSSDDIVLGFVGNLTKQKNVELLIKATALVARKVPKINVIIVGDGPLSNDIENLVIQLDLAANVNMLGRKDNGADFMPAFDIFCLPSNYEGMANVLMEAGAAGIPVVATRVAGAPEVIVENKTGILVPVGDQEAFSIGILELINNRENAKKMGLEARRYMQEKFSINLMVNEYENLYQKIVLS